MAYCPKCGFQNPDDSAFCSKCGASLKAPMMGPDKDWDKQCENQCAGGPRGSSIFWGILVILIGFGILDHSLTPEDGAKSVMQTSSIAAPRTSMAPSIPQPSP